MERIKFMQQAKLLEKVVVKYACDATIRPAKYGLDIVFMYNRRTTVRQITIPLRFDPDATDAERIKQIVHSILHFYEKQDADVGALYLVSHEELSKPFAAALSDALFYKAFLLGLLAAVARAFAVDVRSDVFSMEVVLKEANCDEVSMLNYCIAAYGGKFSYDGEVDYEHLEESSPHISFDSNAFITKVLQSVQRGAVKATAGEVCWAAESLESSVYALRRGLWVAATAEEMEI